MESVAFCVPPLLLKVPEQEDPALGSDWIKRAVIPEHVFSLLLHERRITD